MNDLAVLTPPFLVAAAVITAVVVFLRHEMGRKRVDGADLQEDIPEPSPLPDNSQDSKSASDTQTASLPPRDT